jgi:phospholipase/carboxylesterase
MSKILPLKKIGPLDVMQIPAQPGGGYIVVFHGYGADAPDLISFSQLLQVPPGTGWIFAQGPLKVSDGGIAGRAWFPLDVEKLDQQMRSGEYYDFSKETPTGLKKIRIQAMEMIKALEVPSSRLVVMGFSQGAMVATDIALRMPEKIAGLGILSGALLNKDLWKEKALTKVGLPFFQSHGINDSLLSVSSAQGLEKLLIESGLKGHLDSFRGGHEVPQEIIFKLNQFLRKVLTPQN